MKPILAFLYPSHSSRERREQAVETFRSLKQQIPLLYAVGLVNLVGLHLVTDGSELRKFSAASILSVFLLYRMIHWIFIQKVTDDLRVIAKELLKTTIFTGVICAGFSIWAQILITQYPEQAMVIELYTILAAIGAAYGLSSFLPAAIIPLLFMAVPVAFRLFFVGGATERGVGVSLLLVILVMLRLLFIHNRATSQLIASRFATARERNRAQNAESAASRRAETDVLTGLGNRRKLVRVIEEKMVRGDANRLGSLLALVDLDGFKPANDSFGHAAGDAILVEIASRLSEEFSGEALVARMGGDEFAVFWPQGARPEQIERIGETITSLVARPIPWNGKTLRVSASCGLTEAGAYTTSESELLRQADSALYRAKRAESGAWRLYDRDLYSRDRRAAEVERLLLSGSAEREISVEFQPIFETGSNRPVFAEALARWRNCDLGRIVPAEFIMAAEKLGVISRLNYAIFGRTAALADSLPPELAISFNLSAVQLSQKGMAERFLAIIERCGQSPDRFQFEITETALVTDLEIARYELLALRTAGCSLALDDFGAGYASVAFLKEFEFDIVKLDGSLTLPIEQSNRAKEILHGLIQLCHAAGARCVAEHVETEGQLRLIEAMGCDFVQGHFLAAAGTASALSRSDGKPSGLTGTQG